jgi:restriction system protein
MSEVKIPTYDRLMNPLIQVLKDLGGSGTIDELEDKVFDILGLTDEQLEIMHNPKSGQSEVAYRLAWTRTYLKKYGVLENSKRGVWALTKEGQQIDKVDPRKVTKFVRDQASKDRLKTKIGQNIEDEIELDWQDELLTTLQEMHPAAFERLTQRLLRESGFIQVEVTGRTGDGGVDGKGIMRLGGLLSFNVIFQCKRYSGSVGAGHVRDFRGAMVGRADKALLITTGSFTRDAEREATRDGAPTIDLIDGQLLADKLKELNLGVETKIVQREQVEIDREWFLGL